VRALSSNPNTTQKTNQANNKTKVKKKPGKINDLSNNFRKLKMYRQLNPRK
jgi:hypothetical protein